MAKEIAAAIRRRAAEAVRDETLTLEAAAQEWVNGESPMVLAKRMGISSAREFRRKVKLWMLAGKGDKAYADLVTEVLVNRIADADEVLEECLAKKDGVRASVARDMAKFARTDFERRRPALYGMKQEVQHTVVPQFTVMLLEKPSGAGGQGDVGRVLEHTPSLSLPAVVAREPEKEVVGVEVQR